MKPSMTNHDIMAIVAELNKYDSPRVQNIYDSHHKCMCIKIRTSDKLIAFIQLESGKSIYMTEQRTRADRLLLTSFAIKLRKHLNNKRILSINQINFDRVVDFGFGYDDIQFHLIVEIYASGNIIITDSDYKILSLLHTHTYDNSEQSKVSVNEIYPMDQAAVPMSVYDVTYDSFCDIFWNQNKSEETPIKKLLTKSPLVCFGIQLIEHCLLELEVDPKDTGIADDKIIELIELLKQNHKIGLSEGWIIMSNNIIDTYAPMLYNQYKNKEHRKLDKFSMAVQEYCEHVYKIQSNKKKSSSNQNGSKNQNGVKNKNGMKNKNRSNSPQKQDKKSANIQGQIDKMKNKKNKNDDKISILEQNVDSIDMIRNYIRYAILDPEIGESIDLINKGIGSANSDFRVQKIVHVNIGVGKKRKTNRTIFISYQNNKYLYEFTLDKSTHDHINMLYDNNKLINRKINTTQIIKENNRTKIPNKPIVLGDIAFPSKKAYSITTNSIIAKPATSNPIVSNPIVSNPIVSNPIVKQRRSYWYEQFHWFVSSEGYLVVIGRNADQNEQIVKKHMNSTDLYIHSDAPGSGSGLVKKINNNIPIITLEEAGTYLMCFTKSWNSSPDRTWWVYPDQVSKTPESGEYLSKGSFIIRNKKNFLSIPRMILGLTVMFKNTDSDIPSRVINKDTELAIAMSAPHRCLDKNKYKVKIVPGTQKVGKTIKNTVIPSFLKNANDFEKRLIKNIPLDDWNKLLPNGIKTVMSFM